LNEAALAGAINGNEETTGGRGAGEVAGGGVARGGAEGSGLLGATFAIRTVRGATQRPLLSLRACVPNRTAVTLWLTEKRWTRL
jgi:hypothetical protein